MDSDVRRVGSIAIVGGGTSGWMAAAYLSRRLLGVDVTLVESPDVPVIGVGEATVPILRGFMSRIGYRDDRAWMPACDATYKTGILFEHWYEPGDVYWHPFEPLDYLDPDAHTHTGHGWLALHRQRHPAFRERRSFYRAFFCSMLLNALTNRAPAVGDWAYHFDAGLFARVLQKAAAGVRHVVDNVRAVTLGENGEIAALTTDRSGEIRADLYVDCTGFRRLLMRRVDPEGAFQPYGRSLFCDRAVVIRFPYRDEEEKRTLMHPFVRASAQSAGWIWTIPLYSRLSSGYVYASAFIGDDAAERELRRYWGERRVAGIPAHAIRFSTGKLERSWHRNGVAIGLSGGFIEPLESTGLAITQMGVEMLASMLDARCYDGRTVQRFNGYVDKFYTDILDFIICHYAFSRRRDSEFWNAVAYDTLKPDALLARLEVFRRLLPTADTKGTSEVWMFRDFSWFSVLLGMNFAFDPPAVDGETVEGVRRLVAEKRRTVDRMMGRVPNHYDYLTRTVHRGEVTVPPS